MFYSDQWALPRDGFHCLLIGCYVLCGGVLHRGREEFVPPQPETKYLMT